MSTLRMERIFAAAPAKVFTFITQTDHLLKWWGPEGTSIKEHDLDFSRIGPWSATMVGPQGHAATVGGDVITFDPPNTVALTLSFRAEDGTAGDESLIQFDVQAREAGGTQFVLTQSGLKAEHIPDMRDKGWASALDRLENLILSN